MFHGNAGNIGHRIPIAQMLDEVLGCNILMLEYRGYGLSTGTPEEIGLTIDAQTGLDYIRQRNELRDTKILIYGQSLGGAVAINLVAKNQKDGDISGLILENTFTSIRKLIPRYVPIVRLLCSYTTILTLQCSVFPAAKFIARMCHQYWPSEDILPKITDIPILFLSGLKDEIIPYVFYPFSLSPCYVRSLNILSSPSHMSHLFSICNARNKIWRTFPNGHHNDTVAEPGYFDYIQSFVLNEAL